MDSLNILKKAYCTGVEYASLNTVLDYEQPTKYIVESTNYSNEYEIPVLTAGQTFILGYTDEKEGIYEASKDNPVIIFDDFTTSFQWVDFRFKVKSSAMKILTIKNGNHLDLRYLFHCMNNIKYVPVDHTRQWIEKYSNFRVPYPSNQKIRHEIVRILDSFTELTAREKQLDYYESKLLRFNDVTCDSLKNLCDIVDYRGKTPKKTESGIFLVTAKNIRRGYIDYKKSEEYISENDYNFVMRRGKPQIGDVLITTEAPCGNVAQVDREDIALAQRVIKYRPKNQDKLNSKFLKYILLSREFQARLFRASTGGTVKGIKGSKLHEFMIPLPSIEVQKKIANILEKFESLFNDISQGIPAEIEARKKQYEYYRNELLSFKGKEVDRDE